MWLHCSRIIATKLTNSAILKIETVIINTQWGTQGDASVHLAAVGRWFLVVEVCLLPIAGPR